MNLTGTNSYSGATNVTVGTLQVDGLLTAECGDGIQWRDSFRARNNRSGRDGRKWRDSWRRTGAQTLTVGNLTLNQNSILDYSLSTPGVVGLGVNSLVDVNGNLTLDGILNVGNGGSFGAGRLSAVELHRGAG